MGKRLRVVKAECVVRATNGRTSFGEIELLLKKYAKGTITPDEMQKVVDYLHKSKSGFNPNRDPKSVIISLGGNWKVEIPFKEYQETYFSFKIIEKIW